MAVAMASATERSAGTTNERSAMRCGETRGEGEGLTEAWESRVYRRRGGDRWSRGRNAEGGRNPQAPNRDGGGGQEE